MHKGVDKRAQERPSDAELSEILDLFGWRYVRNVDDANSFHLECGRNVVAIEANGVPDAVFEFSMVDHFDIRSIGHAERNVVRYMKRGFRAWLTTREESMTSVFPKGIPGTRTWEIPRFDCVEELRMKREISGGRMTDDDIQ